METRETNSVHSGERYDAKWSNDASQVVDHKIVMNKNKRVDHR